MEMIAADTNVLIRFLVDDHPAEGRKARALFESHTVLIPETVLMESEWVLRAVYQFTRNEIAGSFQALLGLPNVMVDDPSAIAQVIQHFSQGFDFADALHYARSGDTELKTFDKAFLKKATARQLAFSSP